MALSTMRELSVEAQEWGLRVSDPVSKFGEGLECETLTTEYYTLTPPKFDPAADFDATHSSEKLILRSLC